jgi:aryl-alcohol dehydrogenase-like predicted oxidoreductase
MAQRYSPFVLALGLGVTNFFWNYGSDYSSEQLQEAFKAAMEAGITF